MPSTTVILALAAKFQLLSKKKTLPPFERAQIGFAGTASSAEEAGVAEAPPTGAATDIQCTACQFEE